MNTPETQILTALTSSIRIISVEQMGDLIGAQSRHQTQRIIGRLTSQSMLEKVGGMMAPMQHKVSPVFCWKANHTTAPPNVDSLSYQLKQRRNQKRSQESIYRADKKAFQILNLPTNLRPARRSDWEHDLGVTATWLSLREELNQNGSCWILEDDFSDELIDAVCKPDAVIRTQNSELEFIEYGGCYSADTLRNKFESWEHVDWRLF